MLLIIACQSVVIFSGRQSVVLGLKHQVDDYTDEVVIGEQSHRNFWNFSCL